MQIVFTDKNHQPISSKTKTGSARIKLADFADLHGLSLRATNYGGSPERITCAFEDCEVKQGSMLVGTYGEGTSLKSAMADYANRISNCVLVKNAHTFERQEFQTPLLKV